MNEQQNRVEKYLKKQLSADEYARFEQELATNHDLKEQLQIAKYEQDAMELMLENDLRASMAKWQQPTEPHSTSKWWWLLVACIALTAILMWSLGLGSTPIALPANPANTTDFAELQPLLPGQSDRSDNVEQQSKSHTNTPAPPVLAYNDQFFRNETRGNKSGHPSYVQKVIETYLNKDYKTVIHLTDKIESNKFFLTLSEYRAHAFFHLKKYQKAAEYFDTLSKSGKEPFAERSDWYRLICLINLLPETKTAYEQLYQKIIQTPEHAFRDSTILLIKEYKPE